MSGTRPGFWRRYGADRSAVFGLILVVLILVGGLGSAWIRPGSPWSIVGPAFQWPGQSWAHPLGTDVLGRDILRGVLHGATVSISVGFAAAAIAVVVGTLVGASAGLGGRLLDQTLSRIVEALQSIPPFLLAILILVLFRPREATIVVSIAAMSWMPVARLVRVEVLRFRQADFVAACRIMGMSSSRIFLTQILPNCTGPLLVTATIIVASAILAETGLAFLGLDDPSQMSWGLMIASGRGALFNAWYVSAIPGLAVSLTVLAVNLVGEGLNDAVKRSRRDVVR